MPTETDIRAALQEFAALAHETCAGFDPPEPTILPGGAHPNDSAIRLTPSTNSRPRLVLAAPLAVAACVALISAVISVASIGHNNNNGGTPAGASPANLTSLADTSWGLTSVHKDSGTTITIPQNMNASVTFEAGGEFNAQDGANAYQATYTITTATEMLIADPTAQTTGGTVVGQGRSAAAAANGMHAILYSANGRTTPHSVTVWQGGKQLKLKANGYTLIFSGEVPVATSSAPAPSPASGR